MIKFIREVLYANGLPPGIVVSLANNTQYFGCRQAGQIDRHIQWKYLYVCWTNNCGNSIKVIASRSVPKLHCKMCNFVVHQPDLIRRTNYTDLRFVTVALPCSIDARLYLRSQLTEVWIYRKFSYQWRHYYMYLSWRGWSWFARSGLRKQSDYVKLKVVVFFIADVRS